MPKGATEVRKRIAFEPETFDVLLLLARDRTASLQELMDEAVADLLKKHHRPFTLRDMLRETAAELAEGKAEAWGQRPARRRCRGGPGVLPGAAGSQGAGRRNL